MTWASQEVDFLEKESHWPPRLLHIGLYRTLLSLHGWHWSWWHRHLGPGTPGAGTGVIIPERDLAGKNVCIMIASKTLTKLRRADVTRSREYSAVGPWAAVLCRASTARCSGETSCLAHYEMHVALHEWVEILLPSNGRPPSKKSFFMKEFISCEVKNLLCQPVPPFSGAGNIGSGSFSGRREGITTVGHLAFAVFRPGAEFNERDFDNWTQGVNNNVALTMGAAAAVRRLHYECEVILTSTIRSTVETADSSTPKAIPFAERIANLIQVEVAEAKHHWCWRTVTCIVGRMCSPV